MRHQVPFLRQHNLDSGPSPSQYQSDHRLERYLQKEDGPPPLLYIIAAAGGVAGLAILGCLIRSTIQSVQGPVAWASRNRRLPAEESVHYDDKDQYNHSITDAKYVADPEAIFGVTVVKVPARFTSAHCLPSKYSLYYATPLHSPQVAIFAQDLNAGLPQSQSQTSLAHLNGESSAAIELENRSFLNNPQEPTTTTAPIDPSIKLSNEAQMLGQAEEFSTLAGEQGTITRLVTVSLRNVSDSSELQKSRSLHVHGSEALPSLPQLPTVATMKGSRSPVVPITTLSGDVSPSPPLSSLKSPRLPRSPRSPQRVRNGRAAHLTLNISSRPYTSSKPRSRSTTPTIRSVPLQPSVISTPTSPFTPASFYSSTSRSLRSMPGSLSSYGGGYSNSPVDRKLPAGFASSPGVKTTERFE